MLEDEEKSKKRPGMKNLEPLSVDELEHYIGALKAEIIRTEGEIAKKKSYAAAASSFFKN